MSEKNIIIAKVRDTMYKLDGADTNVAAFLAKNPMESIKLCDANGDTILSTFGYFLDKCNDYNYYTQRLRPLIEEYQRNPISTPTVKLVHDNSRDIGGRSI